MENFCYPKMVHSFIILVSLNLIYPLLHSYRTITTHYLKFQIKLPIKNMIDNYWRIVQKRIALPLFALKAWIHQM
jgi:hypothetical protein